jgi:hypothetical protein
MATPRFSALLVLAATLWLAASPLRPDDNCSITRPGGVKEPGVVNDNGKCCSSFYSNSGNPDDCVAPTLGRPDGAKFYTSVSKN